MKTIGMEHQLRGLEKSLGKRNFAYLAEQGCGKTWMGLADAERAYLADKMDALLVIAPNGVSSNWTRREIPTHLSAETICYCWKGTPKTKKAKDAVEALFRTHHRQGKAPLRVLSINVEAINTGPGFELVKRFLLAYRTMAIVDESTRIKNHSAKRSIKVCELGQFAIARRILTGTPLTKSPTDLFMQFNFLKPGLLGTKSFRAFNAQFSVLLEPDDPRMIGLLRKLGGKVKGIPQINEKDEAGQPMFRNLDKLADLIEPHSFRVRKKDCLDLPDKIYKVASFELSSNQRKIYDQVKDEYNYLIDHGDYLEDVSFEAIAARTKLKQVTSGFINIYGAPVLLPPEDNPRMSLFKEIVQVTIDQSPDAQVIVWAMFEEELKQIKEHLDEQGYTSAMYYGKTPKDSRDQIIDDFQAGKIKFFIGHAAAAGIGITLTAAETAIYYSCSYDNELRMQSEDRNHRIGTKNSVVYWDLIGEDSIDEDVQKSLRSKSALAAMVIDRQS